MSPLRGFMHVPKSAGSSVIESLEASLPPGAVAHQRYDTYLFPESFDLDQLDEPVRSRIAAGDAEFMALAGHQVIGGPFPLSRLLHLIPIANIATVLREPRARLLSGLMFNRMSRLLGDSWKPFKDQVLEGHRGSLEASLADPGIAHLSDNLVCRLVLNGDRRIQSGRFVAVADVEGLVEAALEQLDRLGYVGLLEWDDIWSDLSAFFSVPLDRVRTNVTGEGGIPAGALPIPSFEMRTVLDLIERRSAADRHVYETLLARRCGDAGEARRIADAAFAEELVRFGDLTGASATKLYGAT